MQITEANGTHAEATALERLAGYLRFEWTSSNRVKGVARILLQHAEDFLKT